ncbi:MAG: GIY-YIG nuclease family protein [Agathobacter sp.]|nr:GIY-YIG nuclease family protein [Agathobacter sp.]
MTKAKQLHYCYVLRCKDGSLYTGYTTDVERRVWEHNNSDKGAKYTKSRRPCTLVHSEAFDSKSEAMKREAEIKKLSKAQKENLILAVSK